MVGERRWLEELEELEAAEQDVIKAAAETPAGPGRTVIINGQEFEVVFDGT